MGSPVLFVVVQRDRAAGSGERDARESISPPRMGGKGVRERGLSIGVGDLGHVEPQEKQFPAGGIEAAEQVVSATGRERRRRVDDEHGLQLWTAVRAGPAPQEQRPGGGLVRPRL